MAIPDEDYRNSYQKLLTALYETEFYSKIKNDERRARDGLYLRNIFEMETHCECDKDGNCSVLEMMLALAMRCDEDIMYDPSKGCQIYVWFWEMISNLGLEKMTDYEFHYDSFDKIIMMFLSRTYDKNGFGGPFYIPNFTRDMRKIELWSQINLYFLKNFDV